MLSQCIKTRNKACSSVGSKDTAVTAEPMGQPPLSRSLENVSMCHAEQQ